MPLPKMRGGEAYDTSSKNEFNHVIEYIFDYSKLDEQTAWIREDAQAFAADAKSVFNKLSSAKNSSKDFIDFNAAWLNAPQGIGKLTEIVNSIPNGVQARLALKEGLLGIKEDGANTMRKYVNRIDTGLMKSSIKGKYTASNVRSYVRIGWTDTWFKYFGWQEEGTYQITPMNSLFRTQVELSPRVAKFMTKFLRTADAKRGVKY